ncbi:inosine/xanthosine triphosphatase [Paenibacillus roseipurpureus]|uniref:inosine/xanthosine triphosphatase n=1 Tax=Paenibacillus roseopurpureus TaxID=2918901 RepID=A0AA96LJF2_9BACL|nr:inosine/xanthosine triphosphatase [Paenibacillus sp. MBLB1832]WNR42098.1 inosine/xanthosine triphosphatase [Paenibacillus sp. MBLB1832]
MFGFEWKLALGTSNHAKRAAVVSATGVEPICHAVPSGVPDQPLTEDETILGAINRAKFVLEAEPSAEIGLGLEGGLMYDQVHTNQWYLFSVCAAWNGSQLYLGKGLYFPIPNEIGEKMKLGGTELRHIIDALSNTVDSNHKDGAYGLFTEGRITRRDVFREAVIAALTPFQSSFYKAN